MSTNSWTTAVTGEDHLRQMEKRISQEERRPDIKNAADLMGPGLAPRAVALNNWNSEAAQFNGIYFSLPGAANSPGESSAWIGQTMGTADGFGVQRVTLFRDNSLGPLVTYSRKFYTGSNGVPNFQGWVSESGVDSLHSNPTLDTVVTSSIGGGDVTVPTREVPANWDWFWSSGGSPIPVVSSDRDVTVNGVGASVKTSHLATGKDQTISSSIWAVAPGTLVTVSAWVRGNGPSAWLVIWTSTPSGDPTFFGTGASISEMSSMVPTSTWQKISHSFVVPSGHTKARFGLRSNSSASIGDVWFDQTESAVTVVPPVGVITGEIKMWPSATLPPGYLFLTSGSTTFSAAAYPVLAAILGDTFGVHSGDNYYLPNLRGRVPLGVGTASPAVAGGTAHTLGQTGGEETHTQTVGELATHTHVQNAHTHIQDAHSHATYINTSLINTRTAGGAGYNVDTGGTFPTSLTTATNQNTTATNQNTGSSTPFNVLDPYVGMHYIIKAA